jgi:SAM-dependent methyltransferase
MGLGLRRKARLAVRRGRSVECAVCGGRWRRFEPHRGRPNRRCPGCGSLERHRAIVRLLAEFPGDRLLHVAPEQGIERHLRASRPGYVSADLFKPADVKADIQDMPFEDASFDMILCSHVLEHVDDDRKAIREIRRVLAPGGAALIQVPEEEQLEHTFEDPSITSPEERFEKFGQEDHVRLYGRDFTRRLEEAGFTVESRDLGEGGPLHVCR